VINIIGISVSVNKVSIYGFNFSIVFCVLMEVMMNFIAKFRVLEPINWDLERIRRRRWDSRSGSEKFSLKVVENSLICV